MLITNHPVRKLGRRPFRRIPFAHFRDVESDALLSLERDLRFVPTPLSQAGCARALAKELGRQNALRFEARRLYRGPDLRQAHLCGCVCAGLFGAFSPDFGGVPRPVKTERLSSITSTTPPIAQPIVVLLTRLIWSFPLGGLSFGDAMLPALHACLGTTTAQGFRSS